MSERELRVIRPGDTVLVRFEAGTSPEEAERFIEYWKKAVKDRLPDVEFLVLAGVAGIDVYRPDDAKRALREASMTKEQVERFVLGEDGGG